MIYIFTALYTEAQALIKACDLHYSSALKNVQMYTDDTDLRLLITGTGELNAAASAAAVLSLYSIKESDFLICYGSAASLGTEKEGLYLCQRICELHSGRMYYPDMLYNLGLKEASLLTGNRIYRGEKDPRYDGFSLYDMESAAVFHAASSQFAPHQMIFLRFISDSGENITAEKLRKKSALYTEEVKRIVSLLENHAPLFQQKKVHIAALAEWGALFQCTREMERQLERLLVYSELTGKNWQDKLQKMKDAEVLPAAGKEEGKKALHAFRKWILE